jgi:hypothetical protein
MGQLKNSKDYLPLSWEYFEHHIAHKRQWQDQGKLSPGFSTENNLGNFKMVKGFKRTNAKTITFDRIGTQQSSFR